jgi:hypothetical protein
VWKKFMDAALNGKDVQQFPPPANTGDVNAGDSPAATQTATDQNQGNTNPACIIFPATCTTQNGNGNGNGGNGRRGG